MVADSLQTLRSRHKRIQPTLQPPAPQECAVSLSIGKSPLNVGESTILFAAHSGTVANSWSLIGGGGLSLSLSNSGDSQITWDVTANSAGSYILTFTATCTEGGSLSDSASVEVVAPPTPTFTPTPTPTPTDDGGNDDNNGGSGGSNGQGPGSGTPNPEATGVIPPNPSPQAPTAAKPTEPFQPTELPQPTVCH